MYAARLIVFSFVFLVALVSAIPLPHHHRRSKCHHTSPSGAGTTSTRVALEVSPTTYPTPSSSTEPPKETSKQHDSEPDSSSDGDSGSDSGGALSGLLGSLFPGRKAIASWTTSPSDGALPLDDSTFRPTNEIKELAHSYIDAPDGTPAMKAHYPSGSYNFGHDPQGGISFYAPGPDNVDLSTAKEATLGYRVYFPEGFDWVLGGKLPGLYGGNSDEEARSCSGGSRSDTCFSVRFMWRDEGKGEGYTYLPPSFSENKKVCDVKPKSDCNPEFGASVGRGSFNFEAGQWNTISQRIKLNDVNQSNGEIEIFSNGQSVINVSGLVLRNDDSGRIKGIMMQTFFGGSHPQFATPKAQDAYFSDFSVAITQKL